MGYLIASVVGFFLGWGAVQLSLLLVIFIVYALGLIIFRPYYQVIPTLIDLFVSFAIIIILVLLFVAWGLGGDSSAAGWVLRVVIWIFWITILLYFVLLLLTLDFLYVGLKAVEILKIRKLGMKLSSYM